MKHFLSTLEGTFSLDAVSSGSSLYVMFSLLSLNIKYFPDRRASQ